MKRRQLLQGALLAASVPLLNSKSHAFFVGSDVIKPKVLAKGDTVALIAPGTAVSDPDDIAKAKEVLNFYGLKLKAGKHLTNGSGYKSRTPRERIADLHEAFADPGVNAVFCIRGGYGCIQLLDKIDYKLIKNNPKIFLGYSDVTALHVAINQVAGLVTFHGPVMLSQFSKYTSTNFEKALFQTEPLGILSNPDSKNNFRISYPVRTIVPGTSFGRLAGGNLSLVSSLMGTPYEIDTKGKIVFLEDVDEEPFRIDRMLNQLKLAGKFEQCAGVVFGNCSDCVPKGSQSSTWDATLGEVLDGIFKEMKIPVFYGLLIGHTPEQLTLPIGISAEINADECRINIVETAVID